MLTPSRTIMAIYRPNWSYRPDQAIRMLPRPGYFQVSFFRIRPAWSSVRGIDPPAAGDCRCINLDRPDLAYQVISGAPSGTFVFLAPIASLRNFDEGVNSIPVLAEGLASARANDGSKSPRMRKSAGNTYCFA